MRSRLFYILVEYQASILFLLVFARVSSHLQLTNQWTPQAKIPLTDIYTEEPPILIADQNRTVHAFDSQPIDLENENSPRAIYYRQWSPEIGWTNLNDIILNPGGGSLDLQDVYYDPAGFVHLLIQMNNEDLYYDQAFLADAGNAADWPIPVFIAERSLQAHQGVHCIAALAGNDHGKLVIVFSGYRDGNGLYTTYSIDNGNSWAEPYPIYLTYDTHVVVVAPKVSIGKSGVLYAVWTTTNADGSGGLGFFAKFDFGNMQWSDPIALDLAGIRTPNVIEYDGNLIVSYYHHNVNGNWWRKSTDNGQTWSNPERISPIHIGTNGVVSFVIDSSNRLHAFFGQRIDDNNHGMWHCVWSANGWTPAEAVISGPDVTDVIGGKGFDPRSARAVVLNGNILLVIWGTDGGVGTNGAWYSSTTLNTPELPAITSAAPSITPSVNLPTGDFLIPFTPIVSPTIPTPLDPQVNHPTSIAGSPIFPLVISVSLVLLSILFSIGVLVIIQRIRR